MPAISAEESRIKMVILTAPGQKNITWHSFLKENKKPPSTIIAGMRRRFENSALANKAQVLQFYENGQLIDEHKY